MVFDTHAHTRVFNALPLGDVEEGVDLNAEIVLEIKYGGSVTETRS